MQMYLWFFGDDLFEEACVLVAVDGGEGFPEEEVALSSEEVSPNF